MTFSLECVIFMFIYLFSEHSLRPGYYFISYNRHSIWCFYFESVFTGRRFYFESVFTGSKGYLEFLSSLCVCIVKKACLPDGRKIVNGQLAPG